MFVACDKHWRLKQCVDVQIRVEMSAHEPIIFNPKLYPRPTAICDECKGVLHYKEGPKKKRHWAHHANSKCNSKRTSESETHKLAKKTLVEYLSGSGYIGFTSSCARCKNTSLIYTPRGNVQYSEEVKYTSSEGLDVIFDVAATNDQNQILFAIEVFHRHKTDNLESRNEISWCEVTSGDVLNKLRNKCGAPMVLDMVDRRTDFVCKDCATLSCGVTIDASDDKLIEVEEIYQAPCQKMNGLITHSVELATSSSSSAVIEDGTILNQSHITHIPGEINMELIAKRLGYYSPRNDRYTHSIRRILDEAVFGSYLPDYYEWTTVCAEPEDMFEVDGWQSNSYNRSIVWRQFLVLGRCLKCQIIHATSHMKPYCIPCYKNIKWPKRSSYSSNLRDSVYVPNTKHPSWDAFAIKSERQGLLRRRLSFMNELYDHEDDDVCSVCDDSPSDGVWYGGAKKSICFDCIRHNYRLACKRDELGPS